MNRDGRTTGKTTEKKCRLLPLVEGWAGRHSIEACPDDLEANEQDRSEICGPQKESDGKTPTWASWQSINQSAIGNHPRTKNEKEMQKNPLRGGTHSSEPLTPLAPLGEGPAAPPSGVQPKNS